ncbi:hypothetical protein [Streptomyces sp. NBC_01373]|uniref:hypothetical protein n=1 Tax=Streptomyces sp. NBC_01373 TaxID=2903843 RepID=UPI002255381C|nr:hypothetical protein [Streptomyces sp. NBC_01373]MCX4703927.1 hypothetical protein [Streptomyces sp. NBC_01373]
MSAAMELHVALSLRLDAREAYRLAHAYRDEVLAEADVLPKAHVVAWLVKKAREERAGSTREDRVRADVIGVLASKVERGAIRPDNLRMLPADFFEPGHTYTESDGSTDWKFRCDAITTHPENGERTALGWRHFQGKWEPCAYFEDDFDVHQYVGHTDVTETGDAR